MKMRAENGEELKLNQEAVHWSGERMRKRKLVLEMGLKMVLQQGQQLVQPVIVITQQRLEKKMLRMAHFQMRWK